MTVRWMTAFLDFPAAEFEAGVAFWLALTGSGLSERRGEQGEFATLLPPDGDAYLRVQRTNAQLPGCHLDLHVDDVEAEAIRAVELGARVRAREGDGLVVLDSPGGFGFCVVVRHHGESESVRPAPVGPPGDRIIVDQLCLDIPPRLFESECAFWEKYTGLSLRQGALPEFVFLVRQKTQPIRLLLQRLESDRPQTTAHLDIACDDMESAVQHAAAQGATPRYRGKFWTTLTDPAGLSFCLTVRDPDSGKLRN